MKILQSTQEKYAFMGICTIQSKQFHLWKLQYVTGILKTSTLKSIYIESHHRVEKWTKIIHFAMSKLLVFWVTIFKFSFTYILNGFANDSFELPYPMWWVSKFLYFTERRKTFSKWMKFKFIIDRSQVSLRLKTFGWLCHCAHLGIHNANVHVIQCCVHLIDWLGSVYLYHNNDWRHEDQLECHQWWNQN